jgi:uncharacterized Zn finger protein
MSADKFNCPKCGNAATVTNTVVTQRNTTRYRTCRLCSMSFATVEALKDTPRLRQVLGEAQAEAIWGKPAFKYRTTPRRRPSDIDGR